MNFFNLLTLTIFDHQHSERALSQFLPLHINFCFVNPFLEKLIFCRKPGRFFMSPNFGSLKLLTVLPLSGHCVGIRKNWAKRFFVFAETAEDRGLNIYTGNLSWQEFSQHILSASETRCGLRKAATLIFHFQPQYFCEIQLGRICGQKYDIQPLLPPSGQKFQKTVTLMNRRIVRNNKDFLMGEQCIIRPEEKDCPEWQNKSSANYASPNCKFGTPAHIRIIIIPAPATAKG